MITEAGSDVTLTCLSTGPPAPSVTWEKETDTVSGSTMVDQYRSELVLSGVGLEDTAQYKCVADYGAELGSHESTTADLTVRGLLDLIVLCLSLDRMANFQAYTSIIIIVSDDRMIISGLNRFVKIFHFLVLGTPSIPTLDTVPPS